MKVAYVFTSPRAATYRLAQSGLDRNLEGLPRWCDASGEGRTSPAECRVRDVVDGVRVGCFPDLYQALSGNMPDQVITL